MVQVPWLVLYMIYIIITCVAATFLLYAATEGLRAVR